MPPPAKILVAINICTAGSKCAFFQWQLPQFPPLQLLHFTVWLNPLLLNKENAFSRFADPQLGHLTIFRHEIGLSCSKLLLQS